MPKAPRRRTPFHEMSQAWQRSQSELSVQTSLASLTRINWAQANPPVQECGGAVHLASALIAKGSEVWPEN
ncbi:hypothetical protein ABIA06_003195 [Bradyrhizobium yuanmingense]